MATVRFSDSLKKEIIANAERLFDARRSAAAAMPSREMCNAFYDSVMADYLPHINALPPEFFNQHSYIRVQFPNINDEIRVDFGYARCFPESSVVSMRLEKRWGDMCNYLPHRNAGPAEAEMLAFLEQRKANMESVKLQENKFVDGVKHILNSFVTLAPALKAMPALWDLLPQDTQDKHKEVKTTSKREVDLSTVDLDNLTATIAVAKLVR